MEPNKIESQFKQKLEQRTIQPTEMAWDRLDAMLSVAEKKKKRPNRNWMYIAAAFLVFLLVGVLFLNQEKENNPAVTKENSVVEAPKATEPAKTGTEATKIETTAPKTQQKEAVAQTTVKTKANRAQPAKNTTTATPENTVVPQSQEALAENKVHKPSKITVDANALLASVEKDTPVEQPVLAKTRKAGVKVDSNTLLSAVEGELNESFRDKAYNGVIRNFNAVKTSVANRNRQ